MLAASLEAYKLFHDGSIALSQVEANGMRVDTEYLNRQIVKTDKRIKKLEIRLRDDAVFKIWRKQYGNSMKLTSKEQLGVILFKTMGYRVPSYSDKGRPKVDETALRTVDLPFVNDYLTIEKLRKASGTYLKGILREVDSNGFLHPFFNLNTVKTFRSSSDHPNFQNIPVRNSEIAELIRTAFIPRPGHCIVENDFGGIEVRIMSCYSKDKVLVNYLHDSSKDMHRDMAMMVYKLGKGQVTKDSRYCAKNMFVFPEFYGSYYLDCARNLWDAIDLRKLQTADGVPVKQHLASLGITKLGKCEPDSDPKRGTFEYHIKETEEAFWKRFKQHQSWKRQFYNDYLSNGCFKTLTGFVCRGVYKRNDVTNYPVQGSAFHVLLWSLIQLQKELNQRKMKSKIIGQIHDSIVGDVHEDELELYLSLVKEITTERSRECWKWIIVPMEIEAEVTPINGTWHQKATHRDDGTSWFQ
jgi:DNA polymerase-1